MRKLESLCKKFNRMGVSKVCVLKVEKAQYGYRYLVRFSPTGNWFDFDDQFHFDLLPDVFTFVKGLFR